MLFPYIIELQETINQSLEPQPFHCGSVQYPCRQMMMEHDGELERYDRILGICKTFTEPFARLQSVSNLSAASSHSSRSFRSISIWRTKTSSQERLRQRDWKIWWDDTGQYLEAHEVVAAHAALAAQMAGHCALPIVAVLLSVGHRAES